MKYVEDDENGLDVAIQISTELWNYSISVEDGNEDKQLEKKILNKAFGLDKNEARALLAKMVERYSYLFPKDVQPEPGIPFMFIRKEVRHLIMPFDYKKLILSNKIIPPDQNDMDVIDKIKRLDSYIHDGTEYDKYE